MKLMEVLHGSASNDYGPDPIGDDYIKKMCAEDLAQLLGLSEEKAKELAEVICKLAKLEVQEEESCGDSKPSLTITLGK